MVSLRVGWELLGREFSLATPEAEHAWHYHMAASPFIGCISAVSVEHRNKPLFATVFGPSLASLHMHRNQGLAFKSAAISTSS